MAFKINTIESVEFNGKPFRPVITTELRMRLGRVKFETEAALSDAHSVLADCFPDDREEVARMLPNVSVLEKSLLVAYLLGGDSAVEIAKTELERKMEDGTLQQISEGVKNA